MWALPRSGSAKVWARKGVPNELRPSLVPAGKLKELAVDTKLSIADRTTAVALLAYVADAPNELQPFLEKQQDQPLRIAAIGALSRQTAQQPWQELLAGFAFRDAPHPPRIVEGMLANSDRTKMLLDAIETGQIKANEINQLQVKRLIENRDASIKQRAAKLFAAATPADRAKALADYQPVLHMKGDAEERAGGLRQELCRLSSHCRHRRQRRPRHQRQPHEEIRAASGRHSAAEPGDRQQLSGLHRASA